MMIEDTVRCGRCGEHKPITAFRKRGGTRRGISGYCKPCMSDYERERRNIRAGRPADARVGQGVNESHRRPVGSTYVHHGYVLEKTSGHHRANQDGWVPQHILVAEAKYKIQITRDFTVHHRNGDRTDNRPENLELRVGPHGKGGDLIDTLLCDPSARDEAVRVLRGYGFEVTDGARSIAS